MKKKAKPVKEPLPKKLDLFDFVDAINYTKKDLMAEDGAEARYNPYMVNKALSFGMDTIFLANAMNALPQLDKKCQFQFFINTIRPMRRYNAWVKGEKLEDVKLLQQYYGYSVDKAKSALRVLTPVELDGIRKLMNSGGAHDT